MYKLRMLECKDLWKISKLKDNPELMELLGVPYWLLNLEMDVKFYESYIGNRGNAIRCVIVRYDSNEILGLVSLASINYINQSAELHIIIDDNENQEEIGCFAINAMLDHAFNNMKLSRIEVSLLESNEKEKIIYKKCGFVYEGTKRYARSRRGKLENLLYYSILKEEFKIEWKNKLFIPSFNIAETKDKLIINKIITECDGAFQNPLRERDEYDVLLDKLSKHAYVAYAYRKNVLGYIAFYANSLEKAYVSLVAVNPQYQNQHIGKYLIEYCEDIAKSNLISRIQLEVKKDNKSAILFYQKRGFQWEMDKDDKSCYMVKVVGE